MSEPGEDEHLIPVWLAFAEHFLDTETRPFLPLAALAALEAGLSVEGACEVWCHDVTPVVGGHFPSVGWEWAGWDETWLVESIRARRKRKQGRLGRAVRARFSLFTDGWYWRAIEKCTNAKLALGTTSG